MLFDDKWRAAMIDGEIQQRQEEGYDVVALRGQRVAPVLSPEAYETWWLKLDALPQPAGFPYQEPSDLESIRALRPDGPRCMSLSLSEGALADKLHGAWLGRCAGCLVGKPCEGWRRGRVRRYLQAGDEYPLSGYFPYVAAAAEEVQRRPRNWMRGQIAEMARDDDTDYTILGVHIVERYGRDFSTEDVAQAWLESLPYLRTYTAERVAYHNLTRGLEPPDTATWRNPYREWIGAQIRADGFAYVNPGYPELAADYGYRDARLSHVKNGIYGEMWAAAMIAAAFGSEDTTEVIRTGLSEIPANCRLAEALRETIAAFAMYATWEEAWDALMARYGRYHGVHTINNAVIVALALLYGERDFGRTVSIAVMGGLDTDCNGATAGSVIGAMLGATDLPEEYVAPLNDTLRSAVFGYDGSKISELAQWTLALAKKE